MGLFGRGAGRTLTGDSHLSENSCKVALDSPLLILLKVCLLDKPEINCYSLVMSHQLVGGNKKAILKKLYIILEHITPLYYMHLKVTL